MGFLVVVCVGFFFLSGSADVFSLSGHGEVAVSAARKN